jgi:hypothetical protein
VRTLRWKHLDWIGTPNHAWFDLERDPGELELRVDFESELGKKAVEGYEAEIEGMNAFMARHPVPVLSGSKGSNPPPEVMDQLRKQGYVGGETPAEPK